jgi:CheY-like chemotaxis protein
MSDGRFASFYLTDDGDRYTGERILQDETPPEPGSTRSKVLLVDDQKLIVDTLSEILENAGFEVVAAYDGWEALGAATRFRPDHLVTDVLMPRLNGVELAIAIRNIYPTVKILLFSGQAGISEILDDADRRGFRFEVLAKPVHPLKLIHYLKEHD